MTTEATRATVQDFLALLGEGDPERIGAAFAEQVDWVIAENPAAPWIKPRSTRADAVAHFRELAEGVAPDPARTGIHTVVVDGTEAVLLGFLAGQVRATGKPYEGPFAMRLTVQDGLITRYHLCENSLSVAEACTP